MIGRRIATDFATDFAGTVGRGTPAAHDNKQAPLDQRVRPSLGHPHNLKVVGSNPTPATKLRRQVKDLVASPIWGLCLEPAPGSTVEAREWVIVSESTS
jgi:hypothetical protein